MTRMTIGTKLISIMFFIAMMALFIINTTTAAFEPKFTPISTILSQNLDIVYINYLLSSATGEEFDYPVTFSLTVNNTRFTHFHHGSNPTQQPAVILSIHPDWNNGEETLEKIEKLASSTHHVIPFLPPDDYMHGETLYTQPITLSRGFNEILKSNVRPAAKNRFFTVSVPLNYFYNISFPIGFSLDFEFAFPNSAQSQIISLSQTASSENNIIPSGLVIPGLVLDSASSTPAETSEATPEIDLALVDPRAEKESMIEEAQISSSSPSLPLITYPEISGNQITTINGSNVNVTSTGYIIALPDEYSKSRRYQYHTSLTSHQYELSFTIRSFSALDGYKFHVSVFPGYFSTFGLPKRSIECYAVEYYRYCYETTDSSGHTRTECENRSRADPSWTVLLETFNQFALTLTIRRQNTFHFHGSKDFYCNVDLVTNDPVLIDWRQDEGNLFNFSTRGITPFDPISLPDTKSDFGQKYWKVVHLDWSYWRGVALPDFPSYRTYSLHSFTSSTGQLDKLLAFEHFKDNFTTRAEMNRRAGIIVGSIFGGILLLIIVICVIQRAAERTNRSMNNAIGRPARPWFYISFGSTGRDGSEYQQFTPPINEQTQAPTHLAPSVTPVGYQPPTPGYMQPQQPQYAPPAPYQQPRY